MKLEAGMVIQMPPDSVEWMVERVTASSATVRSLAARKVREFDTRHGQHVRVPERAKRLEISANPMVILVRQEAPPPPSKKRRRS